MPVPARFLVLLLWMACLLTHRDSGAASPSMLSVRHSGAVPRKTGDPVAFEVFLKPFPAHLPPPACIWRVSANGAPPAASGTLTLHAGSARFSAQLPEPGFLTVTVELAGAATVSLTVPAGWQQIQPLTAAPPDLEAFWRDQKTRLAGIRSAPLLQEVSSPDTEVVCYDLQAGAPDAPVSAYLARPRAAARGSLPGLLLIPDARVASASLEQAVGFAKQGVLVLFFNFHGVANGQAPDFYRALEAGPLRNPFLKNPEEALTNLYLRALRAVEVICAQEEWNHRTLAVSGIRQGGALAMAAAALDPRVSYVSAGAPALCDLGRSLTLDTRPWPGLKPLLPPGLSADLQASSLLRMDCAHLAPWIRVPGCVSLGLEDRLCAPAGVAAACNRFGVTPKVVLDDSGTGELSPQTLELLHRALRAHLAGKPATGGR
jgi:cephalosporin-C deacetylase